MMVMRGMTFNRPYLVRCTTALASIAAMVSAALVVAASDARAASFLGEWKRPSTGAIIQLYACGNGLGMRVVASKLIRAKGRRIMCGARKTGANRFEGNLLNPVDGATYYAIVELRGQTLTLKGCVLGGLLCKREDWTRIK